MRKTKRVGKLSRRYARALLSAVQRKLGSDGKPTPAQRTAQGLLAFALAWRSDEQLAPYCLSPLYPTEQRQAAFLSVARLYISDQVTLDFLNVMFQHDRAAALPEVADTFAALADEAAGVIKVELIAARQLSGEDKAEVEQQLHAKVGGAPQFHWRVDPELIGGIVVKFAGKVLDGSVRGRLERIEKELR